ncbi:MAG: hypothetical protein H0T42_07795 [Deltaproteobacteria bacterium]|nr:hypothetical protein [Deltaproteobacteria bacterium]
MIDLSLLDPAQLSTAAQRALGPGPGRMMASKGMLPLPPADQVAVLYQLHLDADASIAGAARATGASLPEKLLTGTLADPTLDPRVLHFFGTIAADKQNVFDAIALNPSVDDTTLAMLAAKGDARGVDQLAQNERRLLRHPEIIAAMYMNRRARMSTIDRVVELAVRNHVRVPGLAAWDEVARALTGAAPADSKVDAVFDQVVDKLTVDDTALTTGDANQALAEKDHEIKDEEKEVPFGELPIPAQIRIATLGNAVARGKAIRSAVKIVALAAIKSPGVTEIEAARYAGNPGLGEDVIRHIAAKREWTKLYGVKVALCRNPKTPISESTKLMPFLRERDLQAVGSSRGIPSAVVSQAKKLMMQRRGGGNK